MEDLFEKMMESQQLKRRRKLRSSGRKRREEDSDQIEGQLLREALGGSFMSSNGGEKAWLDLDHALAARGTQRQDDDFETGWSGESYEDETDGERSEEEEGFSK